MKRFQELLMKDLGWKLLSVAISITMWFMVINITQPIDTRSYSRPVTLENMEALTQRGLTVGNKEELENARVLVKVKAQRTALDRLSQNPEWIYASINLADLSYSVNGDVTSLPVSVDMVGGVTGYYGVVSKTPAFMEVEIETVTTKTFPVEVVLNGEPDESLYLSKPKLSTESVLVTGPRSAVETVRSIKANVNAEELANTPEVHAVLSAYDSGGRVVKNVSLNLREITVAYTLLEPKQVPIRIETIGTPAEGYQIGKITCVPTHATIIGSAEDMENCSALQPQPIDVSDLTASVSHMLTLADYLPEGLSTTSDSGSVAQVIVEIIPLGSKVLTLDASALTLTGQESGKSYTAEAVQLTVSGETEALESLQAERITLTADVTGLTDGTHTVPVHVSLPEQLSAGNITVDITISGDPESPAQE